MHGTPLLPPKGDHSDTEQYLGSGTEAEEDEHLVPPGATTTTAGASLKQQQGQQQQLPHHKGPGGGTGGGGKGYNNSPNDNGSMPADNRDKSLGEVGKKNIT